MPDRPKWQPIGRDNTKEEDGRRITVTAKVPSAISIKVTQDGSNLHLEYQDGVRVIFPTSNVRELVAAKVRKKRNVQLSSDGKTVHWPDVDVSCSVGGIRGGTYGSVKWKAIS